MYEKVVGASRSPSQCGITSVADMATTSNTMWIRNPQSRLVIVSLRGYGNESFGIAVADRGRGTLVRCPTRLCTVVTGGSNCIIGPLANRRHDKIWYYLDDGSLPRLGEATT